MTKDFESDALSYLLDDMDATQRAAFEGQLARFPAARVALLECTDLLKTLRRQALELPFFGNLIREQVALVLEPPKSPPRPAERPAWTGHPQLAACHD